MNFELIGRMRRDGTVINPAAAMLAQARKQALQERIQDAAEFALGVLLEQMQDKNMDPKIRQRAALAILDRSSVGVPRQRVELEHNGDANIIEVLASIGRQNDGTRTLEAPVDGELVGDQPHAGAVMDALCPSEPTGSGGEQSATASAGPAGTAGPGKGRGR